MISRCGIGTTDKGRERTFLKYGSRPSQPHESSPESVAQVSMSDLVPRV